MARAFAKAFYNSKEWKVVREYVLKRDKKKWLKTLDFTEKPLILSHFHQCRRWDLNPHEYIP